MIGISVRSRGHRLLPRLMQALRAARLTGVPVIASHDRAVRGLPAHDDSADLGRP